MADNLVNTVTEVTDTVVESTGAEKIVEWFNGSNVQATVIVLGITLGVVAFAFLANKIYKAFKSSR